MLGKRLILILLSWSLFGCGFQLQDSSGLVAKLSTVYIDTSDPYTIFYRSIKHHMAKNGIVVTNNKNGSDYVLSILADQSGQRVLSVSASNTPREYEVYYLVKWSFSKDGKVIIQPVTNKKMQDYGFDQTQLLGKSIESRVVKESLAKDIVQLIFYKIDQSL